MKKTDILVIKTNSEIVISFDGKKLIRPINGYEDMTEQEIRDKFYEELFGKVVK